MPSSEVSPLWYLGLLEFIALTIPTFLALRYYVSWKRTPLYVWVSVFFGWYIAMGIALMVPIDVAGAAYRQCLAGVDACHPTHASKGINEAVPQMLAAPLESPSSSVVAAVSSAVAAVVSSSAAPMSPLAANSSSSSLSPHSACHMPVVFIPEKIVIGFWQLLYWSAFILCWAGYPLLQSYATAGDFTFLEKVRTSLRENAWFYGAMAAAGIVLFILYLFVAKSASKNPLPVAMAMGNAWGLILLILLLAYGLVEIPRGLWRSGNLEMQLSRCRYEVVTMRANLVSARQALNKTLKLVKRYEEKIDRTDPFYPYLKIILDKCPPEYRQIDHGEGNAELLYAKLVGLHNSLINTMHNLTAANDSFARIVKKAFEVEDVLRSRIGEKSVRWTLRPHRQYRIAAFAEWVWYVALRPKLLRISGVVLAILSLVIIWCECVFFFDKPVLSLLALSITPQVIRTSDVFLLLVIFVPLVYVTVCAYWSFFQLKLFSYYRLIPHQQTDSNSLLFSAAYLCRLAAPLSLNFIHMLKFCGSSFQGVMSAMENMPVLGGKSFNYFAPIALVVLSVCSFFNLATKFMRCLHIRRFAYDDDIDEKSIDEGRGILERERSLWISGIRVGIAGDETDEEARGAGRSTLTSAAAIRASDMSRTPPTVGGFFRSIFRRATPSDAESQVSLNSRSARSPSVSPSITPSLGRTSSSIPILSGSASKLKRSPSPF